jgi:hypothetical protein
MIDGIMFRTYDIGLIAKIHERLDPDEYVEVKSGKFKFPIRKQKHCLTFKIWYFENGGAKLEIVGSIHKFYNSYFNNIDKNCDDFSFHQLQLALDALENDFIFYLDLFTLVKVEIGFNILFSKVINLLLSENLHSYNKKKDSKDIIMKNNGQLLEYNHGDHLIKMYNKSAESKKHFERNNDEVLLRIEVKTERTRETTKAAGLFNEPVSANILRDFNVLISLGYYYLNKVREVLILDTFSPPNNLSKKESTLFNVCSNIKAFYGQKKSSETLRIQFKSYFNLLKEHGLLSLYYELQNKAFEKVSQYIETAEIYVIKINVTSTENLRFSTTTNSDNPNECNKTVENNESENLGISTGQNSELNDDFENTTDENVPKYLGISTESKSEINEGNDIEPEANESKDLGFSTQSLNEKLSFIDDSYTNKKAIDRREYITYYDSGVFKQGSSEIQHDSEKNDSNRWREDKYGDSMVTEDFFKSNNIEEKLDLVSSTLDKDGKPQIYCENKNINKIFQFIQPNNNYTAEKIFKKANLDMDLEYLELVLLEMVNQEYLELHNDSRPYIYFKKDSYPF